MRLRQLQTTMVASCIGIGRSGDIPIVVFLVAFLVLLASFSPASASSVGANGSGNGMHFVRLSGEDLFRLQKIEAQLARVRNTSIKTIESPDGDVIDCVPTHLQPAFEHPKLRGQKPESEPVERPRVVTDAAVTEDDGEKKQLGLAQEWTRSGELCPEGTIPMRRTTVDDVLRADSARRFGMKARGSGGFGRRDFTGSGYVHEHSVGQLTGGRFYGAKATLNVWPAQVASPLGFSLAQIWIVAGAFGKDLNTIETGWQVSPQIYGDNWPRLFTYWTNNAYQGSGCYNLLCSGFVQTSSRIAIGGAISQVSSYNGPQFDVTILVWKDRRQGHWWLQLGGAVVGYWPSQLFTHLAARGADGVDFGGEVASAPGAAHTATQMGSGRFAGEGYARAAYVRNAQVVNWRHRLVPAAGLRFQAERPGCYDIAGGGSGGGAWGVYFYYGGPGRNVRCP